jgi:hypothetical protein
MGVVFIKDKVVARDLGVAQKDYGKYIKIVVDVKNNLVAIGGEWQGESTRIRKISRPLL